MDSIIASAKATKIDVAASYMPQAEPVKSSQPVKLVKDLQPDAKETKQTEDVSKEELKKTIDETIESLQSHLSNLQTTLDFSVNDNTDKLIVYVKDTETEEVIRQIPAEAIMELQEKMQELTGLLLDKTV